MYAEGEGWLANGIVQNVDKQASAYYHAHQEGCYYGIAIALELPVLHLLDVLHGLQFRFQMLHEEVFLSKIGCIAYQK